MNNKDFEKEMLDILSFMLTSARGLLDEPASYGPFRLADGASRICDALSRAGHKDGGFLEELQQKIDEGKFSVMTDMDEFKGMLDGAVLDMTRHLIKS